MIGEKIRKRREELGISQKELAERTELTPGFLSQIERNISEPSITSLRKIAMTLGVQAHKFLMEEVEISPVVKKRERKILKSKTNNLIYELLSPDIDRQMEMYIGKLSPGASATEEHFSHVGEETIYLLQGQMTIKINSDEYSLEEGDSIYFSSSSFGGIINDGDKLLIFVSAVTPPLF